MKWTLDTRSLGSTPACEQRLYHAISSNLNANISLVSLLSRIASVCSAHQGTDEPIHGDGVGHSETPIGAAPQQPDLGLRGGLGHGLEA